MATKAATNAATCDVEIFMCLVRMRASRRCAYSSQYPVATAVSPAAVPKSSGAVRTEASDGFGFLQQPYHTPFPCWVRDGPVLAPGATP